MAGASQGYHEDVSVLGPALMDRHRAIVSIMEELEAIDWYDQRVAAGTDGELTGVLAHNRDEEKEHAAMTLEWLRRHDPKLDEALRTYLFTDASILEVEDAAEEGGAGGAGDVGEVWGLGIGSLRGGTNL
jgi:ferritin-like protein